MTRPGKQAAAHSALGLGASLFRAFRTGVTQSSPRSGVARLEQAAPEGTLRVLLNMAAVGYAQTPDLFFLQH